MIKYFALLKFFKFSMHYITRTDFLIALCKNSAGQPTGPKTFAGLNSSPIDQQVQWEKSEASRWPGRLWLSPVLSGRPGKAMENSLTVERSSFKMSFLSFTLIYYFTGPGIVQRVPCASKHLQVSFGVFLNTIKPVSWYLYISDKLYSTTKNTSRVAASTYLRLIFYMQKRL